MVSLPRLLIYLAWMWSLLHKLSGTPFASFFRVPSCLIRLPYSQTSMYLSFPHHFSALLLSRNIVRLFFACLLSSRCAYRGIIGGLTLICLIIAAIGSMVASSEASWQSLEEKA